MTSMNTIYITKYGQISLREYVKYEIMYKDGLPADLTLNDVYAFYIELGYVPDSITFKANLSEFDGSYPLSFAMYLIDNGLFNHYLATSRWKLTHGEISEYKITDNLLLEKIHYLFPNQIQILFKYWDPIGENIYIAGSNWGTIALLLGDKYYDAKSMLDFVEKFFGYRFDDISMAKDYVGGIVTPELLSLMVKKHNPLMFRSAMAPDPSGVIWEHIQQIVDNDWVDINGICNIVPILLPKRIKEFYEFVIHLKGYADYIVDGISNLELGVGSDMENYPHLCFIHSPLKHTISPTDLFWSDSYINIFTQTIMSHPDRIAIGFEVNTMLARDVVSFTKMGKPHAPDSIECVLSHPEYFHNHGIVLWLQTAVVAENITDSHIFAFESLTNEQLEHEIFSMVYTGFNPRTLFDLDFTVRFTGKFKDRLISILPELHSEFVPTIHDIYSGMDMLPGEELLGLNFSTFLNNPVVIPPMNHLDFLGWLNNNDFSTADIPYNSVFEHLVGYSSVELEYIWDNSNEFTKWIIVSLENNIFQENIDKLFGDIFLQIHESRDIMSYMDLVDGNVTKLLKMF